MLRPGNAGSFTACDHIAVLDAAFAQIPAPWRTDVLVTIDGARGSVGHVQLRGRRRRRPRGGSALVLQGQMFPDLRRCQLGAPCDQAFLLDLAL